jgi:hypothetical protein
MRALLALRNGFCELFSIARIRPSRVSSELATVVEEEERRERGLGGVVDGLLTTVVVYHRLTPRALVVVRREADVGGRNRNLADRSPQRPHPITRGTRRIPRRSFPVATFDTAPHQQWKRWHYHHLPGTINYSGAQAKKPSPQAQAQAQAKSESKRQNQSPSQKRTLFGVPLVASAQIRLWGRLRVPIGPRQSSSVDGSANWTSACLLPTCPPIPITPLTTLAVDRPSAKRHRKVRCLRPNA